MKKKWRPRFTFRSLPLLIGLFAFSGAVFVALFATGSPPPGGHGDASSSSRTGVSRSRVGARTFMKVTPQGIAQVRDHRESTEQSRAASALPTGGNTLWQVDDDNAIADGVAIDANDVWGAWTLEGARLSAYPILGDGTPAFEFSSFGSGSSGVASAKGADRMAFMESNAAGNDFRIHGFRSTSAGVPDWSFPFPETDPNLPASSKRLAVSRDGSTIAAIVSDEPATQSSKLYVFEADTGEIRST